MNEDHYAKLQNMYRAAPCNKHEAPELSVYKRKAVISITVRPNMLHSAGALHDAWCYRGMADAARYAVNSVVTDDLVRAINFNCYMLRQVTSGVITAEGVVKNAARDIYVAEAVLRDASGEPVARGSGAFARSGIKLVPEIGYDL